MQARIELEQGFWFLVVVALLLILCLWGNGDIAFLSVNEARRAVTVREMYQANDWLLPHMNGDLYLAKPPLFYWLALLPVYLAGGVSEWAVRLPSALLALATLAGTFYWGRRIGGRGVGIFACIFLAANAGFAQFARRAEIEMALTAFCFLSLLSAYVYLFVDGRRRWSILSYVLLGCALLTKGPVSLLLVTLPVLVFALIQRQERARAYLCDIPGWLIALSLGASWYAAVTLHEGMDVWKAIFQQDIVDKVSGSVGSDPWYAYLLYLAGDFAPFCLLLLVGPRQLWRQIRQSPPLLLALCATLVPLVVFSLFSDKHAKYLLPTYPCVALLLAYHWVQVFSRMEGWRRKAMVWAPLVVLFGFVSFYTVLERTVFAYRYQALPEVTRIAAAHPGLPLYSLEVPDMRLVYYAGRPVTRLSTDSAASTAAGLLFVPGKLPDALQAASHCVSDTVPKYLSRRKALQVVLLGGACGSGGDTATQPVVGNTHG